MAQVGGVGDLRATCTWIQKRHGKTNGWREPASGVGQLTTYEVRSTPEQNAAVKPADSPKSCDVLGK